MVAISPYSDEWPVEFARIGAQLRKVLGKRALRIDHIGSTSVPGLAAKDRIDVQITVSDLAEGDRLAEAGLEEFPGLRDHLPPGADGSDEDWSKRLFSLSVDGERRANIHVRLDGRANQRYALLFRDYLRSHPLAADAYAELKLRLAKELRDIGTYADVKDPACDLIIVAAGDWAEATEWEPGPSDA